MSSFPELGSLTPSVKAIKGLILSNFVSGFILNGLLLFCFIKGRLLNQAYDYFSLIIVVNAIAAAILEISVYGFLFAKDMDMNGSPLLCNINGCFNVINSVIYLSANLLYSLDRYYRIVKFKELRVSSMFGIFFGMLSFAFLVIILTFARGSHSMTPMGSQVKYKSKMCYFHPTF
jgi:hypothetical protein